MVSIFSPCDSDVFLCLSIAEVKKLPLHLQEFLVFFKLSHSSRGPFGKPRPTGLEVWLTEIDTRCDRLIGLLTTFTKLKITYDTPLFKSLVRYTIHQLFIFNGTFGVLPVG